MKVTNIKCLDSSAWLSYLFAQNEIIKQIVDGDETIVTSSLSIFEIKKRLILLKKEFNEFLNFIKQRSSIISPDAELAEKAADIAISKKLGAIDSLIYATALSKTAELITGDNDFRGLEHAKVIS